MTAKRTASDLVSARHEKARDEFLFEGNLKFV